MALSSSTVECPIPDYALLLFDKNCTGDNATDGVHGNAVVSPDLVAEMSQQAAWKDPVEQLVEKMEVGGANTDDDDFYECAVESSAPSTLVQPQYVVGSEASIADQATLVTSIDDQPCTASLPANAAPSEGEPTTQAMQAAEDDTFVPSNAPATTSRKQVGAHPNSGASGAAKPPSRQLLLVQHFKRPSGEGLSMDFLKTTREKAKSLQLKNKEKTIFPLLSDFILLPPGSRLFVEGEQALVDLQVHREGFSELLSKSKLTAVMPEVIALLLFVKLKMAGKCIGKSFFTLIASCLIGKGVFYCHAGDNIASPYRTLKAVYEAII